MMHPGHALDMFRRRGGSRCVEIGRRIQTYLDDGLDVDGAAKVASHLDACRRCGLTADDYRRIKAALADGADTLPTGPLQRLHALATELASGEATRG